MCGFELSGLLQACLQAHATIDKLMQPFEGSYWILMCWLAPQASCQSADLQSMPMFGTMQYANRVSHLNICIGSLQCYRCYMIIDRSLASCDPHAGSQRQSACIDLVQMPAEANDQPRAVRGRTCDRSRRGWIEKCR